MKQSHKTYTGVLGGLVAVLVLMFTLTCSAQSGTQALIKKRAKDLSSENNARQGVTPAQPQPSRPARTAAPAVQPTYHSSAQPAAPALPSQVVKVRDSLAQLEQAEAPADSQKKQLLEELTAMAQGSVKPSDAKIAKLASDLTSALAGKSLSPNQQTLLAAQLNTALNSKLNTQQMEKLAEEVQATLKSVGAGRVYSAVVANDLRSIIADIQRAR